MFSESMSLIYLFSCENWSTNAWMEKEMATHSSILGWRIPMDRGTSLEGYNPWGSQGVGYN